MRPKSKSGATKRAAKFHKELMEDANNPKQMKLNFQPARIQQDKSQNELEKNNSHEKGLMKINEISFQNKLSNIYNDNMTPSLSSFIPTPSNISADIKFKFWKYPIQPFLEVCCGR